MDVSVSETLVAMYGACSRCGAPRGPRPVVDPDTGVAHVLSRCRDDETHDAVDPVLLMGRTA